MRSRFLLLACFICLALQPYCCSIAAETKKPQPLRIFQWDESWLAQSKAKIASKDATAVKAYQDLVEKAELALNRGPYSVMDKTVTPPSRNKHDYMSIGPYSWPNPDTKDGLPYIRRDGERNPRSLTNEFDAISKSGMIRTVKTLAVAYYFSGDEKYASRATLLLRTWFLDPKTRMNPNLQFSQSVPGVTEGRCFGLIETGPFREVIDSIGLIENSRSFTADDRDGLKKWFREFRDWMLASQYGKDESEAKNNHGSWCDVQLATYNLYLGEKEQAKKIIERAKTKRIAIHIEPDGRQPAELVRTKSFSYSVYNLTALFALARLGEHVDIDLWNYTTEDKRNLRAALNYLIPYIDPKNTWPHEQIVEIDFEGLSVLMAKAARHYKDAGYEKQISQLPQDLLQVDSDLLLHPMPAMWK